VQLKPKLKVTKTEKRHITGLWRFSTTTKRRTYFQTIRYGWNTETPLAVLTDFKQFHVLDCRYKPDIATTLHRHVAKYHYSEYFDRKKFAAIYWLFSHEAVADGSLEKRAKDLPKPRGKAVQLGLFPGGYQSIDESFLKELDEYRTALARTFKSKNPALHSETLTELVQRTLDRLVFLRFLEDKGIEPQRLVDRFGDKGTVWEDFIAASRRLDGIYNGVVFKHHTILDSDKFRVDETAFADICENLAHINSPYDFDAILIYILGSIYERFLGNVIVATEKRVRVEPKPEVRKAGGVYYTPEYVVRYIVANTVGDPLRKFGSVFSMTRDYPSRSSAQRSKITPSSRAQCLHSPEFAKRSHPRSIAPQVRSGAF
jgi:hypothetical protein